MDRKVIEGGKRGGGEGFGTLDRFAGHDGKRGGGGGGERLPRPVLIVVPVLYIGSSGPKKKKMGRERRKKKGMGKIERIPPLFTIWSEWVVPSKERRGGGGGVHTTVTTFFFFSPSTLFAVETEAARGGGRGKVEGRIGGTLKFIRSLSLF